MSKCPLLIATPNHWVVDCYGEECAWFHSVCKQPQKAKTNTDRIRAMTDEELAELLRDTQCNSCAWQGNDCDYAEECKAEKLEMLKQGCDENGT